MAATVTPRARRLSAVLELLGVVALFLVGVIYLGAAAANQDPLWFYPAFDERPATVYVYRYGQALTLAPNDPGYNDLVAAVNADIPRHAGYYESYALSADQAAYFRDKGYAVELVYGRTVRVHTRFYFPPAPRLLIGLDGPYNYTHSVLMFRGSSERWLPGALALQDTARTRAAIEALLPPTTP